MEAKQMQVLYGPRENGQSVLVTLNGVTADEPLTPRLAAQAARIACGHRNGVTVWDTEAGYGYRLYANTARKLYDEV